MKRFLNVDNIDKWLTIMFIALVVVAVAIVGWG